MFSGHLRESVCECADDVRVQLGAVAVRQAIDSRCNDPCSVAVHVQLHRAPPRATGPRGHYNSVDAKQ